MNIKKMAIVGLGSIGAPIAANIASGGFEIIGFDKAGTSSLLPAGVEAGHNICDVIERASVMFLAVPDKTACIEVVREVLANSSYRTELVVNFSTIGIEGSRQIEHLLSETKIDYIDAPVSGGQGGAMTGSLTMLWSGSRSAFKQISSVVNCIAKSIIFVGPKPGQAQAVKLLNNYLSAVAMAATSEAITFGMRHGLQMETMLTAINASSGQNTATLDKFPNRVLSNTYDSGFRMALMKKDVELYAEESEAVGTLTALCQETVKCWQDGVDKIPDGDATEIFRSISESLEG
ncbi:MAG: NADPH nitroreductase [Acidiferrobacteraceae bacterium]|nr:NADPH nitroreductase [Acidiferrobacteraceae bacterium]